MEGTEWFTGSVHHILEACNDRRVSNGVKSPNGINTIPFSKTPFGLHRSRLGYRYAILCYGSDLELQYFLIQEPSDFCWGRVAMTIQRKETGTNFV